MATQSMMAGWQGSNYSMMWTEIRRAIQSDDGSGITSFLRLEGDIAELESVFGQKHRWSYAKNTGRLSINTNWKSVAVGSYILIEGWMALDPEEYNAVFNDPWFKEYAMWLVKEQWGVNLTKFTNVQFPGGIELNGEQIASDARENIARMREDIEQKFQMPPMMTIG
jgi:hypothetical protein